MSGDPLPFKHFATQPKCGVMITIFIVDLVRFVSGLFSFLKENTNMSTTDSEMQLEKHQTWRQEPLYMNS